VLGSVFFEYQLVFRLPGRTPVGLEALARHASGASPPVLVAEARRRGVLPAWEARLFGMALREAAPPSRGVLFFNVTRESFRNPSFARAAAEALRAAGVCAGSVVLEVSARELRRDAAGFARDVSRWKDCGVLAAVDDFGGERDLGLVAGFPRPAYVKVDGAAVMGVWRNRAKQEALARVLAALSDLAISAVLEGVEDPADLLWIEGRGGSVLAQGYALARPVPIEHAVTGRLTRA
jgi:EAL domain-containing protein (putative c-di-GMP-specific phosphodiesterase class I)